MIFPYLRYLREQSREGTYAGVVDRAVEVFGDQEYALAWLGTPLEALGYATPISKLGDRAGVKEVMDVLTAFAEAHPYRIYRERVSPPIKQPS